MLYITSMLWMDRQHIIIIIIIINHHYYYKVHFFFFFSVAHYFNFLKISSKNIIIILKELIHLRSNLNVIPSTEFLAYLTIPGITGILLSIILVLMYSSAVKVSSLIYIVVTIIIITIVILL